MAVDKRSVTLGLALGVSAVFGLALTPFTAAEGAYPSWGGYSSQVKRPTFRPWRGATERSGQYTRWRPHYAGVAPRTVPSQERVLVAPSTRKWQGAGETPVLRQSDHNVANLARASRVGTRFRPDRRFTPGGVVPDHTDSQVAAVTVRDPHIGFRPTDRGRRGTYEDMQAAAAGSYRSAGRPGYGAMTHGLAPTIAPGATLAYPRYWPAW